MLDLNEIGVDVSEIYIMVDRSGRHAPTTYSDGTGKTVYLTFEFLSEISANEE